eukprot:6214489-Pleurochrysis_carterae.AAC.1
MASAAPAATLALGPALYMLMHLEVSSACLERPYPVLRCNLGCNPYQDCRRSRHSEQGVGTGVAKMNPQLVRSKLEQCDCHAPTTNMRFGTKGSQTAARSAEIRFDLRAIAASAGSSSSSATAALASVQLCICAAGAKTAGTEATGLPCVLTAVTTPFLSADSMAARAAFRVDTLREQKPVITRRCGEGRVKLDILRAICGTLKAPMAATAKSTLPACTSRKRSLSILPAALQAIEKMIPKRLHSVRA